MLALPAPTPTVVVSLPSWMLVLSLVGGWYVLTLATLALESLARRLAFHWRRYLRWRRRYQRTGVANPLAPGDVLPGGIPGARFVGVDTFGSHPDQRGQGESDSGADQTSSVERDLDIPAIHRRARREIQSVLEDVTRPTRTRRADP